MLDEIAKIAKNCRKIVVLTGAGISAESGVPTFRGKEGLWGKFKAEELATMDAFMANPAIVWEWYNWRRDLMCKVEPNPGHYALAEMEKLKDDFTLVTQNVDGLHKIAGSQNILELHGNIYRNKCVKCNRLHNESLDIDPNDIPTCESCGGKLRPDVVWFGEMLDRMVIETAFRVSEQSELFFSVGTSAIIHPAASLPMTAKQMGATLVEVNPEETPLSYMADYSIRAKSGEYMPELIEKIKAI